MGTWGRALVAAIAGVVAAACSPGGGPPQRGFGSVQLVPIRDPSLSVVGQWSANQFAYSLTDASGAHAFYFLDVTSGQVTSVGSKLPPFSVDTGGDDPLSCEIDIDGSGHASETITDSRTGQSTVIRGADFVWPSSCPSPDSPELMVWTKDDAGHFSLSAGPYTALAPVPIDVIVSSIVTVDPSTNAFTVVAAEPAAPDALGIYRLAPAVGASVPVVAPALGDAAWAAGATPPPAGGPLASASLAPNPGPTPVGDHFVYARAMSDGSTVMFAGPFAGSPAELALFPADATLQNLPIPTPGPTTGFGAAWAASSGGQNVVRAWNPTQRQLVTCSAPATSPLSVTWQPAPDRLVIGPQTAAIASLATGPLLLLAAGDTPCTLLADKDAYDIDLSPDNSTLTWLVSPNPLGNSELWTAAIDGSAVRKLGTGAIGWSTFISNREVELSLDSDLAWLTLDDDPPRLHYIAEGVFGQLPVPLGDGSWWLVGYDYSEQDATGTLGIVQRDTGQKRAISGSVVWHQLLFTPLPDMGSDDTRVVYLVRGRNPSAQDGIWMATVTADELR
jgi:hypothetical protein